jgi:hypothetical protein
MEWVAVAAAVATNVMGVRAKYQRLEELEDDMLSAYDYYD